MNNQEIIIKGARENNLKGFDLHIPKNKLIAITGISGSGKSSLVHDIIYKEAQRLFMEALSTDSRRLLKSYSQPKFDSISGLSPVIAVSQKTISSHWGSTVGTMSGIYDLLRLLMARFGKSNIDISPLKQSRRLFSFNTKYGSCPQCEGLGLEEYINPLLLIKDPKLSLREGALKITTPSGYTVYSQVTIDVLNEVCKLEGFDVDTPWQELTDENRNIIFYGSNKIKIPFGKHSLESRMKWSGITAKPREEGYYRGIIPIMSEILKRDRNDNILRFVSSAKCSQCNGSRLNKEALSFYFQGKNMADFVSMDILELYNFFNENFKNTPRYNSFKEIRNKILEYSNTLIELGLSYLTIERKSNTLSAGESQRIRMSNMTHSTLSGLLYIFDEPSVGLHYADQQPLKNLIHNIVKKGNTVLLIEHEQEMINNADWLIDIGPEAGNKGGELIYSGTYNKFINSKIERSVTQEYFLKKTPIKNNENYIKKGYFKITNADINNLKKINVKFQNNAINVVCGVSGSGKSSLVMDTLAIDFKRSKKKYLSETNLPKNIISISQSPIGRTPRSNPATYTKVFDKIRTLFAKEETAKNQKLKRSDFSFNVKGGRCESCQGAGYKLIGMHFIGEVEVKCEHCNGKRFKDNILSIKYKSKNIKEVLDLSIREAAIFFQEEKAIKRMLDAMMELGLGYIKMGQRATTLSGGEAQRIKLAAEMVKKAKQETLYILDEPTTGLHAYDIEILINAVKKLRQNGHTIVIVEHNEDILRIADNIIELGPKSGKYGGEIVFQGDFSEFIKQNSITSSYLKRPKKLLATKNTKTDYQTNNYIDLKGVKTNNLKNINIKIPKNKFNVFTGISGSGKSSLAFDTIYKAGSEAYYQTLPTYIRARINHQNDGDYENISGLTACLSLKQNRSSNNSRSTVGTYSGIYDLLRLIYSRISTNSQGIASPKNSSLFSFNKQESACTICNGLGEIVTANERAFINNPNKSIYDNSITDSKIVKFYLDKNGQYYWTLKTLEQQFQLNIDRKWKSLTQGEKKIILWGDDSKQVLDVEWHFERKGRIGSHKFSTIWKGIIPLINEEYERKYADHRVAAFVPIMKHICCPICNGNRLKKEILDYKIQGKNIAEISGLELKELIDLLEYWKEKLSPKDYLIAKESIDEIINKTRTLSILDLGYLSLNRTVKSLSGGEMQRLSIAGNLGSKMSGITYIFDEPSKGLHKNDIQPIIESMEELVKKGNTVIAVEHNFQFISKADHVFEFGPGSGNNGGKIINEVKGCEYKQTDTKITRRKRHQKTKSGIISILSANANNLKNIDIDIPTNKIIGIHGVSGSGKTSLLKNVILESYKNNWATNCKEIRGLDKFEQVIYISANRESANKNQKIANYFSIEKDIRRHLASTNIAKENNKKEAYFSNTSKEGKCHICNGTGAITIKMDFMSSIEEQCSECGGSGYNNDVLEYKYRDKNIAEIMKMRIVDAVDFFEIDNKLQSKLNILVELGIGYLRLEDKTHQLSMGEMQRIKLARHLVTGKTNKTLFLVDEASRGLSNKDLQYLFNSFDSLIMAGNSIIMIEHNEEVLAQCDYLIEIGPGAGNKGGHLVEISTNFA